MRRLLLLTFTILIITALFFLPRSASAQGFSLAISPPILEIRIKPDQTIYYTFDIKNESDQPTTVTAAIQPFQSQGNQGKLSLTNEKNKNNFFSLINAHLSLGQEFTLKAEEKRQLVLRVAIPKNQADRDYYQVLLVKQIFPPTLNTNNKSQAIGGVGAPILLNISSDLASSRQAEIMRFAAKNALAGKIIDSFSSLDIELIIKNTGQTFFKPLGELVFTKKLANQEKEIKKLTLQPNNILADQSRHINCLQENCRFDKPFLFGHYLVTVNFQLGAGGAKYQSRIDIWAFPYKATLLILPAILLLAIVIKYLLDKYHKKVPN